MWGVFIKLHILIMRKYMKIEDGKFYFIKDNFFEIFKGYKLMENKENGNKRPCYFCFKDKYNKNIIWFVPISTKYEKYQKIYENKRKKQTRVYNFVFGEVVGKNAVFLIQNVFPTTKNYILEKYITENKDVEISLKLKNKVIARTKQVIHMAERGINIPFYDINEMKKILLKDLK